MKETITRKSLRTLVLNRTLRLFGAVLIFWGLSAPVAGAQTFPDYEVEPNGNAATATPIPSNPAKMRGYIYLGGDHDYYSFTANAGDRVYAATMTSFSSNASVDSHLELFDTDGVTSLEADNDDGSFGTTSSSIAGFTIPATGTYFLRVRHNSATTQLRPYDLYVQVRSGSPTPEVEPNDAAPGQPLPASGWVSGTTYSTVDLDLYTINLNAGETVFLSLDLDPERDMVEWNGQVGLGPFNGIVLGSSDTGTSTPDSEAAFFTVKEAGTYYVQVGVQSGATFGTYHLSVSRFAAETGYTNYASTDVPVNIPSGPAVITSTLTIPDSKRIKDLSVRLDVTHSFMNDLDMILTAPDGNSVHLISDIGSVTAGANTSMNMVLNDFNAIPPLFAITNGLGFTPELSAFLDYFKGMEAQGTWTLTVYDDAVQDGGTLNSWSLDILEDTYPNLTGFSALFDEDFETDDGGFTHSGTGDEWERGTPTAVPITTAHSGTQCWKTDLDNTYNASTNQTLESPDIDLTAADGEIIISWAMKYQIERPDFDQFEITLEEVGGGGLTQPLFIWYGADMVANVGNPVVTVQLSAGWATFYVDISAFAGKTVRFKARLITDTSVQRAGVAIDDVKVYYKPDNPIITASAGAGGSISPSGEVIVEEGQNQTFTITPNACFSIADVLVDGASVGAVPSYTFNNITANHTISATFAVIPTITYYRDMDGDGFGNPGVSQSTCTGPPAGYVTNNTDCNDNNALEKPGQVWYADLDNDGYSSGTTLTQCLRPVGYKVAAELTATSGDCNDGNAAINPGAMEICDGIDNNCVGGIDEGVQTTYYRDMDGDGFGNPAVTQLGCSQPAGYVTNNTDCNDNNALEKPGQVWYADLDNDGYSSGTTLTQCLRPVGYKVAAELTATSGDCNDNNAAINPGAIEVCDGMDNDCNNLVDDVASANSVWQNGEVGSVGGTATYPPCQAQPNDVFTISSTGFSTSSSDKMRFVYQNLCGNGEIIARVVNVASGGWAGVMMRESLAPGSKRVALKTQLSSIIRREIRSATNGATSSLNFNRPNHVWLRLVRSGSNFVGYTSETGLSWDFAFSATVSMTGCIHIGLFSESINTNVTTTATFTNVSITGFAPVPALNVAPSSPKAEDAISPEVYPNPTTGEVNIDLSLYADPIGTVRVFDAYGKLMSQKQLDGSSLFRLKMENYADGVYFLSIAIEGKAPVAKRVVIAH